MHEDAAIHHGPIACFSGQHIARIDVLALDAMVLYERDTTGARTLQNAESPHVLQLREGWGYAIRQRVTVAQPVHQELIRLWNGLPSDEQMRCHYPAFALQFWLDAQPVFTASLCWGCNNVFITGPMASTSLRQFDSGSVPANALLRMCQRLAG